MKSSRFIRTKVDFHGNPTSILYFLHEKFIWNLVLSRSSQCFGSVSEPIKMQETISPVLVVARTVYRTTFTTVILTFLGEGGGGGLFNSFSFRRCAYSKGGVYLKLGANSCIYGTS